VNETGYRAQVLDNVASNTDFIKATFSGRRRGYELAWRRVTVRPVAIRGERLLQFSYLDERQATTKNYAGSEAAAKLEALLDLPFSQIHVMTTEEDLQVQISRKGKVRVHHHAAPESRSAPSLDHDRRKPRLLSADAPDPFLQAVGIQTASGRIRASKRRKFRQIHEFLRLITETDELAQVESPVRIVDCGCGSADLTFAIFHYLSHELERAVEAVGIDVKEELLAKQNQLARDLGWRDLRFEASRIIDYTPPWRPDVVLALHACDTATDEALAQAVRWDARLIFSAPCCHHDLQAQLEALPTPEIFEPVVRHGILKERIGDVLTDSFRAQILRILGYRTDIVEFISPEHTDKNLMIRAVKTAAPGDAQFIAAYRDLIDFWGVTPYLARLLEGELREAGVARDD
jgi:SAM-dependent methyltransferase